MKKLFLAICAILLLCDAATAADRAAVSITHALGAVSVPLKPERVVVMDFGSLDTLDAMGVTARLAVPKTNLPAYLAKYRGDEYIDVGGLKEFNLETISAFKPELIIISGRQQDYYKELSSIAPVLFVDTLARDYFASVKDATFTLGAIFDARGKAEAGWADIAKARDAAREAVTANPMKALIILTNDGKVSAYGSSSRFGIIHDELGVPQADPTLKAGIHGQLVNYEYIAMIDPEIIFVVDRSAAVGGKADGARLLDNALVNKTRAANNKRIVALDPQYWYLSGGGLESLGRMIADIENAFRK